MITVSTCAIADVDLTGMRFDDLAALRGQVETAILESEEYKEVEVPIGDWYVGEHIPAGEYRIVPKDYGIYVRVWG